MTTTASPAAPADRFRWGRIVIGALALEILLIALAVPLLPRVENPLAGGDPGKDYTIFFAVVTAIIFVISIVAGWWVARPLPSKFVLHGLATGVVATVLYLVLVSIPPNTIAKTAASYGLFWFVVANAAKPVGGALGSWIRSCAKR